jgi:hypothetical protein
MSPHFGESRSEERGEKDMMTLIFMILMIVVFSKLFVFAARATWGISKIIVSLVLLPVFLVGLALAGLIQIALPILLIVGVFSLLVSLA